MYVCSYYVMYTVQGIEDIKPITHYPFPLKAHLQVGNRNGNGKFMWNVPCASKLSPWWLWDNSENNSAAGDRVRDWWQETSVRPNNKFGQIISYKYLAYGSKLKYSSICDVPFHSILLLFALF